MEWLKHWLKKGWLSEVNVDLPLEEKEKEVEGDAEMDSEG